MLSSSGPKPEIVARIGTPLPTPPSEKYSVGKLAAVHCWPMPAVRFSSFSLPSPGVATPDRSPLMSAANTATPAAESCSASTCSVRVLPVPVAPATRPWRFVIAIGMRTGTSGIASPLTRAPISRAGPSNA